MRRLARLGIMIIYLAASNARAEDNLPKCITAYVPNATVADKAQASYMLIDLYDVTLFTPQHAYASTRRPLALQLVYKRSFSGDNITDRTIKDIRNRGFQDEVTLATWHEKMRSIMPDVDEGTSLIGILTVQGETLFYENERFIGKISDPAFGQNFFGIWLDNNSSEPIVWEAALDIK